MTKKIHAVWYISLNCDCPKCVDNVDLTRTDDFWGEGVQPAQDGPLYAKCPECGHEFTCEMEY